MIRINKFLADSGICSRRQADQWIQQGRVKINDRSAVLGDIVNSSDAVLVDEKPVRAAQDDPVVILAYNKPRGVEVTGDPENPRNIMARLNYTGPERVVYIGRLDVASEGLILFTNKGDLVNKVLRSKYQHEKEYVVVYDKPLTPEMLTRLRTGVDIGDGDRGPTLPCKVDLLGAKRVKIVLTEGRNRQIRRMAEALGLRVLRLKRIRVMNIELGELKSGTWKLISGNLLRTFLQSLERPES